MSAPRCFKCENEIEPSGFDLPPETAWEMPNKAVVFDGTGNYGSALYDAPVTGIMPRILVCDECLKLAEAMVAKIKVKKAWER